MAAFVAQPWPILAARHGFLPVAQLKRMPRSQGASNLSSWARLTSSKLPRQFRMVQRAGVGLLGAEMGVKKWLLEPIGDGEASHLDSPTSHAGPFVLDKDGVLGRVVGNTYIAPVATVSGSHARLEQHEGAWYVKDLSSTNGTYINTHKINPGEVMALSPGDAVIFGDEHLAAFVLREVVDEYHGPGPEDTAKDS